MQVTKYLNKATLSVSGVVVYLLISTNVHAASNGLIAYSCLGADGNQNICLIRPDGTGKVQFTTSGGFNALPSWSPTGEMLAYTNLNPQAGTASIVVTNINVFNPIVISPGLAPAWSPD
jgi:hypothetical protein